MSVNRNVHTVYEVNTYCEACYICVPLILGTFTTVINLQKCMDVERTATASILDGYVCELTTFAKYYGYELVLVRFFNL